MLCQRQGSGQSRHVSRHGDAAALSLGLGSAFARGLEAPPHDEHTGHGQTKQDFEGSIERIHECALLL